ncbi:MAG: (deoxy)nucleoside triphosphate pyrophosphohydrolase [Akkermansiaceae bacterium]|jgi:8-oxo-dGTP diphosphatase|nr:(deoxy)nucleoside triphosphate pyrophosphohydrolase [Akkermansiaceae bacterium]
MIDVVAGLILDAHGRLLACRRPEEKHLGGLWEFPGGKIEAGESPATALVRELHEELGIDVAVLDFPLSPVVHDYGRGPIRLIPLACTIVSGTPAPHEHSEIRWCPPHEIQALDLAAADLPILHEWLTSRPAAAEGGRPNALTEGI